MAAVVKRNERKKLFKLSKRQRSLLAAARKRNRRRLLKAAKRDSKLLKKSKLIAFRDQIARDYIRQNMFAEKPLAQQAPMPWPSQWGRAFIRRKDDLEMG